MDLQQGIVVYSLAGHDKGDFQVIVDFDDKYAKVCDGKYRPLERPKKKRLIHIKATKTVLDECALLNDRALRNALRPFIEASNKYKASHKLK